MSRDLTDHANGSRCGFDRSAIVVDSRIGRSHPHQRNRVLRA
jgi:hypothetical protein